MSSIALCKVLCLVCFMSISQETSLLNWLLSGDVSIQYQTWRDLLGQDRTNMQQRIAREGWGAKYLSLRNENNALKNKMKNLTKQFENKCEELTQSENNIRNLKVFYF